MQFRRESGFVDGSLRRTRIRPCVRKSQRAHGETYRRYVSLYTYTRGQVNALSPPDEAAEEILISRFFVDLFLAPPSSAPFFLASRAPPLPPDALHPLSGNPNTDKSGSEEELAAGRPGH